MAQLPLQFLALLIHFLLYTRKQQTLHNFCCCCCCWWCCHSKHFSTSFYKLKGSTQTHAHMHKKKIFSKTIRGRRKKNRHYRKTRPFTNDPHSLLSERFVMRPAKRMVDTFERELKSDRMYKSIRRRRDEVIK